MENKELAQELLNKIIGLRPTRVKLGYGSFITIDLGRDIAEEIKTRQGKKVIYFGEWHFWVYMCAWRIDQHNMPLVGSNDDREIIQNYLRKLDNKTITNIRVLNTSFDVVFSFEDGIELYLFSSDTKENEHWKFYTSNNKVFTAGPGHLCSYKNDSE